MDDLAVLRQKNPQLADFIQLWREKYQRNYDFDDNNEVEKANFYEGAAVMARHMAIAGKTANLTVEVGTTGGPTRLILWVN